MELKLWIQQAPQFNLQLQQVHFDGANPQTLKAKLGGLPSARQWPQYNNPIDVTGDVSDLFKLKLTWTNDRDDNGVQSPGQFRSKKSASGTLVFEGNAYQLIKKWLIEDVSAPLNSVAVKIEHSGCGTYEDYTFKATDIRWCEGSACTFEITLRQQNEALNCIKRTPIADNHQGWFPPSYPTTPANGKRHPRFSYCNEIRPNAMLIIQWWLTGVVAGSTLVVMIAVLLVLTVIKAVLYVIHGIISIFGGSMKKDLDKIPDITDLDDMIKSYVQYYIESAGCGREHPAPLIRDYISNVCKLCNVQVDDVTAPIFFAQSMQVETSGRGVINTLNHHYNACYLNAPIKRGIRRFKNINFFGAPPENDHDFWIPDNAPIHTLDTFLDELKTLYNAEWRLVNNKLYFQRKDYFVDGGPVLDLTTNGADRMKLLEGICFEWNELKYHASCKGLYSQDPVDTCGNEAMGQVNGAPLSFGKTDENPNFLGVLDKTVKLGAAKFRLDGAATDYLYDAMQVVLNGQILQPWTIGQMSSVATWVKEFADYALLLRDETMSLPKILIWDGVDYMNAKAVRPFSGHHKVPANGGPPMPTPNSFYNTDAWDVKHPPQTFVKGSGMTIPSSPDGYYYVSDMLGALEIKREVLLPNFFMYFEPGYEDTLWDWFHWIDDPIRNPKMNMDFTARLELCCDTLKKLKLFGDGTSVVLGHQVKVPGKYFTDGRIKEIEVSYDTENETGQYIQIKGGL